MVSKVYMTCFAYEQGFGSGLQRNGVSNPYLKHASDEHEAWAIGYSEGEKRAASYDEKENKMTNHVEVLRHLLGVYGSRATPQNAEVIALQAAVDLFELMGKAERGWRYRDPFNREQWTIWKDKVANSDQACQPVIIFPADALGYKP